MRSRRHSEFVEVPQQGDEGTKVVVSGVSRALQMLEAFEGREHKVGLTELARRTHMSKTTGLRLLRALEQSGYVMQLEDGDWRLAHAAGRLGARYRSSFDADDVVEPLLVTLSQATGETAAFYVRERNFRTCLAWVGGPQPFRHHVPVGTLLPLDQDVPGRVLLAFAGEHGKPYDAIRDCGYHLSISQPDENVSAVAAPVFGLRQMLLGCVCVSGPADRLPEARLLELARAVVRASRELSLALGGTPV